MGHIPYYGSLDVFLWTIGNTVSPLLLILGYFFKPYKWSLAAPGAAFSIQMMYIFRDVKWVGKDYFWLYTALFFITMLVSIVVIQYLVENVRIAMTRIMDIKDSFLEYLLELKNGPIRELAKAAIEKDLYDDVYQGRIKTMTKAIDNSIKNKAKSILENEKPPL
tara:strand:+ start:1593 stop:2084 length:492 start_codon:yes stop_codon:yes gene_type:complete